MHPARQLHQGPLPSRGAEARRELGLGSSGLLEIGGTEVSTTATQKMKKAEAVVALGSVFFAIEKQGAMAGNIHRMKKVADAFTALGITERWERFDCAKAMGFDIVSAQKIAEERW